LEKTEPAGLEINVGDIESGPGGPGLFDIRDDSERVIGQARNAVSCTEQQMLDWAREGSRQLAGGGLVLCAQGVRSLALVKKLRAEGFEGFFSVAGGFKAWSEAGLPARYPAGLSAGQSERYARHLVMEQVGPEGQRRLSQARILLVGLGGLNSPAALYLAAAGVGTLGLVDDDRVERSNLQRQIIHGEAVLGELKIESARNRIHDLNPEVETVLHQTRIDRGNVGALLQGWDMVVDGTDNFDSRYLLNEACVARAIPLIYGAVMRFQGQVSVFWPASGQGGNPCYRCLLPQAPAPEDTPNCSVAGVLGVLPGIVGAMQASEAIKLALGMDSALIGNLLLMDALNMDFRRAAIKTNPACPVCAEAASHSS
jgi:molybdopterin/thiamine biosynthesis adenylyltransferase/rhodanese-related sulfurtransferase